MKKFIFGLSLWLFTILVSIALFFPVFVTIHEYCHLATCVLLGGEGSVSFGGTFLTGSFMQIQKSPENFVAFIPLSGGLGTFIICSVALLAICLLGKKLPKWTIFVKGTLLFWGTVGLIQAIPEWYFWKNLIFLGPIENVLFFLIYLSIAASVCQFIYEKKSLDLFLIRKNGKLRFQ